MMTSNPLTALEGTNVQRVAQSFQLAGLPCLTLYHDVEAAACLLNSMRS